MRTSLLLAALLFSGTSVHAQAVHLDGMGDYMHVENNTSLQLSDEVSIAAWVKLAPVSGTMCIARQGGSNTPAYSLNRESTGHFVFFVHVNGAWQLTGVNAGPLPANDQWYHVVGTYDGSAIELFVNGVLEASVPLTGPISTSNDIFSVGSDVAPFSAYYNGWIDEVSVWNKALYIAQVQTVMADTLGPAYYATADSGLVAYWRFEVLEDLGVNGGGVDDVRDLSLNGNHGDLVGDAVLDANGGPLAIGSGPVDDTSGYFLDPVYPAPSTDNTRIRYGLPAPGKVALRILDMHGRTVHRSTSGVQAAGTHEQVLDVDALAPGTYTVELHSGPFRATRKMIVMDR